MLKLHETIDEGFSDSIRESKYVSTACNGFIRLEDESVTFKLQAGNVKDYGVNGVQCEELLLFTKAYLNKLNTSFSSVYNEEAVKAITVALAQLKARTLDRESRGVEGKEEA